MQIQYFGDVTDFYKFFFLKNIIGKYKLGINWCLTSDDGSNDGKNKIFRNALLLKIDNDLYNILLEMKFKNIQLKYFNKNTMFYNKLYKEFYLENDYETSAFNKLKNQDVIFFDPDNGIETPSAKLVERYKYVSYRTISKYWNENKSIIIFQHKDRQKDSLKIKRDNLINCLKCKRANILIVNSKKVFYICILNKGHKDINNNINNFCNKNKKLGYKIECI